MTNLTPPEPAWVIAVSDWPIGRADYDLTAGEALAALSPAIPVLRDLENTMTTPPETPDGRFYPLVDARCTHFRCDEPNVYRTVGHCTNCRSGPFLVLVSSGHEMPLERKCPKCGCYRVRSDRLAEDDELPDNPALVAGRDPAGVSHHLRDPAGNDTSLASQTHAAAVDHVLGALVDERMPALPAEGRDPAGGAP